MNNTTEETKFEMTEVLDQFIQKLMGMEQDTSTMSEDQITEYENGLNQQFSKMFAD